MNGRVVALGVAATALIVAVVSARDELKAAFIGAVNLVGMSITPTPANSDYGPSYLVGNQPWIFGQPSTAVLPSVSQQTSGGTIGPVNQFDALNRVW